MEVVCVGLGDPSAFSFQPWRDDGQLVAPLSHGIGLGIVLPWVRRRGVPASVLRVLSLAYVIALSAAAHGVWK